MPLTSGKLVAGFLVFKPSRYGVDTVKALNLENNLKKRYVDNGVIKPDVSKH